MLICRKLPAGGGEFLHPGMIKVEMQGENADLPETPCPGRGDSLSQHDEG